MIIHKRHAVYVSEHKQQNKKNISVNMQVYSALSQRPLLALLRLASLTCSLSCFALSFASLASLSASAASLSSSSIVLSPTMMVIATRKHRGNSIMSLMVILNCVARQCFCYYSLPQSMHEKHQSSKKAHTLRVPRGRSRNSRMVGLYD